MINRFTAALGVLTMVAASTGCSSFGQRAAKQEALRAGEQLIAQQRYGEAAAAYRRALELDPSDAQVHAKLGEAYVLAKDFIRAADLMPDDDQIQIQATAALLQAGRFPDAIQRASDLARKRPEDPAVLTLQGRAAAKINDPGWMMFMMSEAVGDPIQFEVVRKQLRPPVPAADDERAEALLSRAVEHAPTSVDAVMALADLLWLTGQPEKAQPALRALADANPKHAVANYAVGSFLVSRGRPDEAGPYLENAGTTQELPGRSARLRLFRDETEGGSAAALSLTQSMRPEDDATGEVSMRLASLDARASRPAEAVRRIDALLERVPNDGAALLLKAQILYRMGNPDLRYVRAAIAADPKSSQARVLLGEALAARGETEEALQEYTTAIQVTPDSAEASLALGSLYLTLGRMPEALIRARDAVRLAPGSKDAALLLVAVLVRQKDFAAAERILAPLQAAHSNDPRVTIQTGLVQAGRGQEAAARASLMKGLTQDPASADALVGLLALEPPGTPSPEVRALLDTALEHRPHDVSLLMLKAQVLAAAKDASGAEATLRVAFDLDRGNVSAGLALASTLNRAKRPDDAVTVLNQVLERRPKSLEARTALAVLFDDAGRDKEAEPLLAQIVDEDPGAAMAAYRLAVLYLPRATMLDRTLELAMMAKRGLPDDSAVDDLLGQVYTQKGLTSLALGPLRDAVAADPKNPLYRFHLGEAYERIGNRTQARNEFAAALEIDPNFPGADRARTLVAPRR